MPASTIFVSYPDGSPCSRTKVVLGLPSGMSQPGFTDDRGQVTIQHSSTGQATVYVSGKDCGSFRAPNNFSVVYR